MSKEKERKIMELNIGYMSNEKLAEWFGIKPKTLRNTKRKRMEELKYFCSFEQVYRGN